MCLMCLMAAKAEVNAKEDTLSKIRDGALALGIEILTCCVLAVPSK